MSAFSDRHCSTVTQPAGVWAVRIRAAENKLGINCCGRLIKGNAAGQPRRRGLVAADHGGPTIEGTQ
jgi:hypothetical protein